MFKSAYLKSIFKFESNLNKAVLANAFRLFHVNLDIHTVNAKRYISYLFSHTSSFFTCRETCLCTFNYYKGQISEMSLFPCEHRECLL